METKCTCERPDDNTCEYCEKQQEESILAKAKADAWSDYEYTEGELYSTSFKDGFELGVKWQKEQDKNKHSDEDVMNALHSVELKYNKDFTKIYEGMKEWFNKFKNK